MNRNTLTVEILKKINKLDQQTLVDLIKKINKESIVAQLSKKIVLEYLKIVIKSKFLDIFIVRKSKKIVAYALISNKPDYLISEFESIKYKILYDLIKNFKFLGLLNIGLALTRFDKIFITNKNDLIRNSLNINLLAVDPNYQSLGIGKKFISKIIKILANKRKNHITCETFSTKAIKFYKKKCKFRKLGIKLRFFKNLTVLGLKIN